MTRKTVQEDWVGNVDGALSNQYSVRVTQHQKIVVVTGPDNEWRWPLADYQNLATANGPLFHRVAALLRDKGYLSDA